MHIEGGGPLADVLASIFEALTQLLLLVILVERGRSKSEPQVFSCTDKDTKTLKQMSFQSLHKDMVDERQSRAWNADQSYLVLSAMTIRSD